MNENTRQATAAAAADEARRQQQQPVATRTRRSSNTSTTTSASSHDLASASREQQHHLNGAVESLTRQQQQQQQVQRVKNTSGNISSSGDNFMDEPFTTDEIVTILEKEESNRDLNEVKILKEWSFLIPEAEARIRKDMIKQRSLEREESLESIENKADVLAMLIREANYTVIYTGAGISTSASIPDYRGPNGLWTQIKKTGTFSLTQIHDLSTAEPTLTHMAIRELCRRRIVKHVVSQNCDGLHIRSGIPQKTLSEIHGNMYIEVCPTCEKQYFRQADVTERTSRFRHKTGRKCHTCTEPNNNLIDTIVLYGERSKTQWPMNWERAGKAAKRADLIICMGSSLKTLRRYFCLWPERVNKEQPKTKLVIINLQYTSKDKNAVLKINGRCDLVMQLVMQRLNIDVPVYDRRLDPLNHLATPFTPEERAHLKRNLVFESSPSSPPPGSLKRQAHELSQSPSLFVSELTDDPEKKRLRMRIRAVNSDTKSTSPSGSLTNQDTTTDASSYSPSLVKEEVLVEKKEIVSPPQQQVKYAIPGWLGKSLGASRSTSYRRKRHGNKGKKHSSVLKQQQQSGDDDSLAPSDTLETSNNTSTTTSGAIVMENIIDTTTTTSKKACISMETPINGHLGCSQQHAALTPTAMESSLTIIKQETLVSNQ